MSLYRTFAVESAFEQEGIYILYGDTRFKVARAGGTNHKFRQRLQARLKPYRRQLDNDTMDESISEGILLEVYAETVVLGWETKVVTDGVETWEPWVEGPGGEHLPFNKENCVKVLKDLPELFRDLRANSDKAANFRKEEEEADLKN